MSFPVPLKGITVVTDTNPAPTHFHYCAILVVDDAVISDITLAPGFTTSGSLKDLTKIPTGTLIYCRFSTLTLTSGEVILYHE